MPEAALLVRGRTMKRKQKKMIPLLLLFTLIAGNSCYGGEMAGKEAAASKEMSAADVYEDTVNGEIVNTLTDQEILDKTNEILKEIQSESYSDGENLRVYIDPTTYIPVLMYHHFLTENVEPGNGTTMKIDEFENHLKAFREAGYTPISFEELYRLMTEKQYKNGFGEKYICITIDDGYYSNFELAYPLLEKYGMIANISVITSRIHTNHIYTSKEIPKMTWDDLNEMTDSGLVYIYNHSMNHVQDTKLCNNTFKNEALKGEDLLDKNMKVRGIRVFTYPYGDYNFSTTTTLRQLGYDLQITTDYGVVNSESSINKVPRITISSGMSGEDVIALIEKAAQRSFGYDKK